MPKKSKNILHIGALSMLSILLVYSVSIGFRNFFRYNTLKIEELQLKKALEKLNKQNENYKNRALLVKSDDFWILSAKKKLGYIKPGEKVYKFVVK